MDGSINAERTLRKNREELLGKPEERGKQRAEQ